MASAEADFIRLLQDRVTSPAARGLQDDAALLEIGGARLLLTKDLLVEGVHYLPDDPPEDVAWKLAAVNLSDLAGKGARPVAALLGFTLRDADWDRRFAIGLLAALDAFDLPLVGGDTVSLPTSAPRVLSITAIGEAGAAVPSRTGARAGDDLWVTGTIGDAGLGLAMLRGGEPPADEPIRRYRAPRPRLEAGRALAPLVHSMMDISDGLLIDAARMAHASAVGLRVDLDSVPLSDAYLAARGSGLEARILAATAGDDYELLFAALQAQRHDLLLMSGTLGLSFTRIGRFENGAGLGLTCDGEDIPLPDQLGWEHQAS